MSQQHEFTDDWEKLYQERDVETMPWYNSLLDADLDQALNNLNIKAGTLLDLGTGPATQAIALAQRGFQVTASDISEAAIAKAENQAKAKGLHISFKQDDILDTHLDQTFDFVFDRGCFHILNPERRQDYVGIVHGLLPPQGYLFLKCMSQLQTIELGAYRFTPEQIKNIFGGDFKVISIEETVYQGILDPLPKALFSILQKF
jgi:cyclopropane fatty-acyl-phospholipid synthase-like methyltransferase